MNGQRVTALDDLRTAVRQFGSQREHALAFLKAEPSQVGKGGGLFRERCENNGCHDAITEIVVARDGWRQWPEARETRINLGGRGGGLPVRDGDVAAGQPTGSPKVAGTGSIGRNLKLLTRFSELRAELLGQEDVGRF